MLKSSGLLFLLPCALLVGMWAFTAACPGIEGLDGPEGAAANQEPMEARLTRRIQDRQVFLLFMYPTLEDLERGRLTLRQASAKLIGYSHLYHGDYVFNVSWAEEGATLLEKVARNCVRHIRVAMEGHDVTCEAAEVLSNLEWQLAQVAQEESAQSSSD